MDQPPINSFFTRPQRSQSSPTKPSPTRSEVNFIEESEAGKGDLPNQQAEIQLTKSARPRARGKTVGQKERETTKIAKAIKPKKLTAQDRVNQFGREHGIVIEKNGLWCPVCQEALSLKSSSLKDHFATSKHKTGLMKKEKANLVQQNLIKFLESDEAKNELPVGEGTERLALAHLAFRVETMEELMRLGLYQYLDRLRPLLERNNYSLSSKAHLSSMIPMLNHRELDRLGALFNNSDVGLVCDELTYCGCIIGCVARTVTDDLKLIHQLIGMKHIAVSPNSKQLAASINNLCARVHLDPERILTLCTDSASVPRAAADILKNIYAFMTPTNCISHISNNIGKKIDTPRATSFVNDSVW